ncbi:MAG TPA: class I SAM-dependent methyltransferase [Candidatus Omnitrophota bacterium]|nr:methyltransferase domain-containing protein [Candidatus Omnitrophota bacterium]HPB67286.1 class I SAM-dependent methyltransferase [Candidatus Omnitrophota bacterium]HQO57429.1 class I SAM-dependent methyltransferase [Candidatus Omnitrophota bacterium]
MNSAFHRIYFFLKVGWLLATGKKVTASTITDDYNALARMYDESFSVYMAPHARHLVQKLPLSSGGALNALDLACGTGTLTQPLSERLAAAGVLTAVDLSEKMVEQAKKKLPRAVIFRMEDMMRFLLQEKASSYDAVTCGWAIGYSRPQSLIKEIHRVLTPGGAVGIIENRQNTLFEIRETAMKVMMRYPQHIRRMMDLTLRLPRDKDHLSLWFRKAGLKVKEIWDGQIEFCFKNGVDVLNWVLHTGASAGFDRVMDPDAKYVCDLAFIQIMEKDYRRDGQIKTAHRFVAGVAQK